MVEQFKAANPGFMPGGGGGPAAAGGGGGGGGFGRGGRRIVKTEGKPIVHLNDVRKTYVMGHARHGRRRADASSSTP